jgi:hypothetical protein
MSTPDDNIVVEQRMATSSTSQVEELGISGLPVAIPFRTMVERRLSWTDSAVATRRQASRRMARWATIGETESRPGLLAVIEKSRTE